MATSQFQDMNAKTDYAANEAQSEIEQLRRNLGAEVPEYLLRRLVLDVGGWTEQRFVDQFGEGIRQQVQEVRERLAGAGCPVPAIEARTRYGWIR